MVSTITAYFVRTSSLKTNGARPVRTVLVSDGHQYFSTCATTKSVPVK
jgi:hypothetical protein